MGVTRARSPRSSAANCQLSRPSPAMSRPSAALDLIVNFADHTLTVTITEVVVGVRHDLMRAGDKPQHAVLQVIEAHSVVTRIAAGRLQPHPGLRAGSNRCPGRYRTPSRPGPR